MKSYIAVTIAVFFVWSSVALADGSRPLVPTPKCKVQEGADCIECHTFDGNDHALGLADQCDRCHGETAPVTDALAKVCAECHENFSMSKHPKLKHPLRSSNDPQRPGWELDCASCHDPHAPDCLSCLNRMEQRKWCKGCHSTP